MPITPHTNSEPLLKRCSFRFQTILIVVWSANCDGSALTTSKASSNLLNDDTYRCFCAGTLCHPSGQIEQGAPYIRKSRFT